MFKSDIIQTCESLGFTLKSSYNYDKIFYKDYCFIAFTENLVGISADLLLKASTTGHGMHFKYQNLNKDFLITRANLFKLFVDKEELARKQQKLSKLLSNIQEDFI